MPASCEHPIERASVAREWCHDALQDPAWGLHPFELPNASPANGAPLYVLPLPLLLSRPDPEVGEVLQSFGRPTASTLARILDGTFVADATHRDAERLVSWVAEYDRALIKHVKMVTRVGERQRRQGIVRVPPEVDQQFRRADAIHAELQQQISPVLAAVLKRRLGQRLHRDELNLFLQLSARDLFVPALQVCDWCDRVFPRRQNNARRCAEHRKSRKALHPASAGGWHLGTYGDPSTDRFGYIACCVYCSAQFNACDARQKHCAGCGSQLGRVQRFRGQRSADGGNTTNGTQRAWVVDSDI